MPKQVLEITDFTGGLNCYSDARDIKDKEFSQNWNANVSQSGIIKFGGALFSSIANLPHTNTTNYFQTGYGLFSTGVDYSYSVIDGDFEDPYTEGAIAGYSAGTPSITLKSTSSSTDNIYNNYSITIYSTLSSVAPQGQTRRIVNYVGSTKVATLDSAFANIPSTSGNAYYKIFTWVGDGTNFGNSDGDDYIDKGGSDFPYDDINAHNPDDTDGYFLRTKVSSIANNQSKDLGFVTYNPKTSDDVFTASDTDSTTIGNITLKSGVEYVLSFYCKGTSPYYGYVADGSNVLTSTGVVNNADAKSASVSSVTMTVDGVAATSGVLLNRMIYDSNGVNIGVCTAVNSTTEIVFGNGINIDVGNDTTLYTYPVGIVSTGIYSNNTAGTISATSPEGEGATVTLAVDTVSATDALLLQRKIYKKDGTFIGVCTAVNSTTVILFGAGTAADIEDNTELYTEGHGERVPFVQLYSDSITDGTNTGLYLSQSKDGAVFLQGADSTYGYADLVTANFVDNGDFEDGGVAGSGGDGGQSATYDPPTGWMAYDGFIAHTNNAITYSYNADSDSFGGEGNTLKMTAGSALGIGYGNIVGMTPNCYMYQDIVLPDNQWYELSFAYSSSNVGMGFLILDTQDLVSTAVLAAEAEDQDDGAVTLTVDGEDATSTLFKNREVYNKDGIFLGVCTAVTDVNTLVFTGGTHADILDNTILYTANGYLTRGLTQSVNGGWEWLPDTGGETTYRYIGQSLSTDYIKPKKFFVQENSGKPKIIRIAFAPLVASGVVRLDGVTVRKSFPDLLSMSTKTNIGNPYDNKMLEWTRYQMKFSVPSSFRLVNGDEANDWVLRLYGGTWGYQASATYLDADYDDNNTIYFDSIRLETNQPDNLVFLNDNTSNESKINIYSSNSQSWITNGANLKWSGIKMKPVYNYINGLLKISDANFDSGNTSKIFYYSKVNKLNGAVSVNEYRSRDSAISEPPISIITSGSDSVEVVQTFDAKNYINSYTYAGLHQWYGETPTETNWPCDDIGGLGRVLHYYSANSAYPEHELVEENGTELTVAGDTTLKEDTHPFYLAWAGQDGTDNDMGGKMDGITTGSVSKVEFEFDYSFASAYRDSSGSGLAHGTPPKFEVKIGKMAGTDIFTSGAPSTANKKLLVQGQDVSVTEMANEQIATFQDNGVDIDQDKDTDFNVPWQYSSLWPWSTIEYAGFDGHYYKSTKTYTGQISFEKDKIAITDDMIMKFSIDYPTRANVDLGSSITFNQTTNSHDWGSPRWEKVRFESIKVHFHDSNWTAIADGMVASESDKTKINFLFGTPTSSTAVGWEERIFKLATSSVNVFDEESHLNINESPIGGEIEASTSSTVSTITFGQSPNISVYVGYTVAKDDFRKKIKYYMKDTESDIWYLQFYVDLENNRIHSTTSNHSELGIKDDTNQCYAYFLPKEKMLNYNEVDSYESQTLVSQDSKASELTCDYKTAVVANNRLYVGNIRQDGNIYPDRMIKSPIGKYNILPKDNFIDVAINDGDEIIALEFFKDKLLQFKRNKVFIMNISGDYEFLEDTFENVGITLPCQVTRTPFGIAWVNGNGCYIYDGSKLTNLIDRKIASSEDESFLSQNFWALDDSIPTSSVSNIGSIAYNYLTKDLIIRRHIGANINSGTWPDGYIYNIPTQSWYFTYGTFSGIFLLNQGYSSNFTIDKDGNTIQYLKNSVTGGDNLNNIMKWDALKGNDEDLNSVSGRTSANQINQRVFYFTTKDFTFGNIAARKKIYKVYITFKSVNSDGAAAHSYIKVKHATNGGSTFTEFADSSTNYSTTNGLSDGASSTDWITAELKPSSSINNVYSMQLSFVGSTGSTPSAVGFQINDISIVYRPKRIK